MKTKLEKQFTGTGDVKGFQFTQVKETDNGYIYKVEHAGQTHYEAFLKRESAVCIDFANRIYSETDTKESYPKSNDFGVWAWTFIDIDNATTYLEIVKTQNNENNS